MSIACPNCKHDHSLADPSAMSSAIVCVLMQCDECGCGAWIVASTIGGRWVVDRWAPDEFNTVTDALHAWPREPWRQA